MHFHNLVVAAATAAVIGIWAGAAAAVDVTNKGSESVKVTVISAEGRKTVTVPAGESVQQICSTCTIENPQGTKRDASGAQTVTLTGTLLLVSGQP